MAWDFAVFLIDGIVEVCWLLTRGKRWGIAIMNFIAHVTNLNCWLELINWAGIDDLLGRKWRWRANE